MGVLKAQPVDDLADSYLINNTMLLVVSPDEYCFLISAVCSPVCLSVCLSNRLPGLVPAFFCFLLLAIQHKYQLGFLSTAGSVKGDLHFKTPLDSVSKYDSQLPFRSALMVVPVFSAQSGCWWV